MANPTCPEQQKMDLTRATKIGSQGAGGYVVSSQISISETQVWLLPDETTEKRTNQKNVPKMSKTSKVYHKNGKNAIIIILNVHNNLTGKVSNGFGQNLHNC